MRSGDDNRVHAKRKRLLLLSRLSLAAAVTVFAFGLLLAFGGVGYAADHARDLAAKTTLQADGPLAARTSGGSQYAQRFPVCHEGQTIMVTLAELEEHGRHGDTPGPCRLLGVRGASERGGDDAAGVAGVRGRPGGGGGVGDAGSLPFTGLALGTVLLFGGMLLITGLLLRRAAREYAAADAP